MKGVDTIYVALHNSLYCCIAPLIKRLVEHKESPMSVIEKSLELNKALFELNSATFKKLAELDTESFQGYMDLNKSTSEKMMEIKSVAAWMDMQRSYSKSLWDDSQSAFKAKTEICQQAYEEAGQMIKDAMAKPATADAWVQPATAEA